MRFQDARRFSEFQSGGRETVLRDKQVGMREEELVQEAEVKK